MNSKTEPVVDDLTSHEYEQPCDSEICTCETPAAWAVYISHYVDHKERHAYLCDAHMHRYRHVTESWMAERSRCWCGIEMPPSFSDLVRAIRL